MKKTIAFALAVALSPLAWGEDNNSLTDQEKKEGWTLLWDGKSAKGWSSWKTKKPLELGAWSIKDGALTLGRAGATSTPPRPTRTSNSAWSGRRKGTAES